MSPNRRGSKISLLAGVVLVLLLVAGATPYLISKTNETQDVIEAGVGDKTSTHVTLEQGNETNLTSWLKVSMTTINSTDDFVEVNITNGIDDTYQVVHVNLGEEDEVNFDTIDVSVESKQIESEQATIRVTHPEEEDTQSLSILLEYIPYLFLLACLICILIMLGVIYK